MTLPAPVADLHVHSTHSDGTLTPEQLAESAGQAGIRTLALSDHDTLAGCEAAARACARLGLAFVPAVELNTDVAHAEVHILGYWVDGGLPWFGEFLARRRAARRRRGVAIVEELARLGLDVSYRRVQAFAKGEVVARPHVARAMVEAGLVADEAEAYEKYLGVGRPAHVVRDPLSPTDAIRAIGRAGGVAVLAHPAWFPIEHLIPQLVDAGLAGIECYYSEHTPEQTSHFLEVARSYGLVPSVGSDSHGPGSKKPYAPGSVRSAADVVEQLRLRRSVVVRQTAEPGN